jgi:hypothetical protein
MCCDALFFQLILKLCTGHVVSGELLFSYVLNSDFAVEVLLRISNALRNRLSESRCLGQVIFEFKIVHYSFAQKNLKPFSVLPLNSSLRIQLQNLG